MSKVFTTAKGIEKPSGFSWTAFFWGWWVPAFRGGEGAIALKVLLLEWSAVFVLPVLAALLYSSADQNSESMIVFVLPVLWLASILGVKIFLGRNYNKWSQARQSDLLEAGVRPGPLGAIVASVAIVITVLLNLARIAMNASM